MGRWTQVFGRLFGNGLPEGFPGTLAAEEHALGSAAVTGGGHLVVTALGLWVPDAGGARRVGWHLVSKARWSEQGLTLTEAEETGRAGAAVLLTDRAPVFHPVAEPGKVPLLVRQRVDASIRSRHHQELPGGGAWFVRRKVPGTDETMLQARPDPGTDPALVAGIADAAAARMAAPED